MMKYLMENLIFCAVMWQLVYGKIQYKSNWPTVNIELLRGHCFYLKKIDVLCKCWNLKILSQ